MEREGEYEGEIGRVKERESDGDTETERVGGKGREGD